ncbi:hypothetical protein N7541_010564 [Penicillium brevicompactum]|uniref:Uncharacterized protein n=1 Tax=Penicillium brevicompactum TaxID=5074 RepID=A0A9W9QQ65_PENBR|nr:hypothetical protein N7541_010564 [Penicillium brevicompactum]
MPAHKIYCAPKAPSNEETSDPAGPIEPETEVNVNEAGAGSKAPTFNPADAATSSEMKALLEQYPELRSQLQELYQSTLEEEWVESYTAPARGRGGRGRGRGGMTSRSRGPWTAEKGFKRGLGRVRKVRQDGEEGKETGQTSEAFMRFLALVNRGQETTV